MRRIWVLAVLFSLSFIACGQAPVSARQVMPTQDPNAGVVPPADPDGWPNHGLVSCSLNAPGIVQVLYSVRIEGVPGDASAPGIRTVTASFHDSAVGHDYSGSMRYDVTQLRTTDPIAASNADLGVLYVTLADQPKGPTGYRKGWGFSLNIGTLTNFASSAGTDTTMSLQTEDCTYAAD